MKDKIEQIPFQLNKRDIEKLEEEKKIRFMGYGMVPDFFAVLETSGEKVYYRKSKTGMYYLLPRWYGLFAKEFRLSHDYCPDCTKEERKLGLD